MELTPGMLGGIVAGTTAGTIALARVVEVLVKRVGNGKGGGNGDLAAANATVRTLCDQVRDLHQWHDIRDSEGRLMWLFPTKDIKELTEAIKELTVVVKNGKGPTV